MMNSLSMDGRQYEAECHIRERECDLADALKKIIRDLAEVVATYKEAEDADILESVLVALKKSGTYHRMASRLADDRAYDIVMQYVHRTGKTAWDVMDTLADAADDPIDSAIDH